MPSYLQPIEALRGTDKILKAIGSSNKFNRENKLKDFFVQKSLIY
jgi:hypothetical protein